MAKKHIAVTARITGRVQGVFYRGWTRGEAERLGLTGWVRNEPDGSVAALLAGPEQAVAEMIEALWRGPQAAAVADVVTQETEPAEWPARFIVLR